MALGDGFVDLHVEWPAGRFAVPSALPAALYGSTLAIVLGAALLAGYLLLRDVHRETEMAAMRSHFVASVSHELKTPLTSIRAHAETLLMGRAGGAETTSDYLRTIVSESERLTRLVDSVLDLSRIEQGRKTYHLQATRLDDVVRSAATDHGVPARATGLHAHDLERRHRADGARGSGGVDAGDSQSARERHEVLRRRETHRDAHRARATSEAFVDVVDHGIGIARDEQSRIFERFHRVQSDETAGIAGTGLGLTLALHVVEAHRGRIAVASAPGSGSTFSVRIPLQAPA